MDEQKPKTKAIPAPDLGYDRWILIDENTGRQNLKNLNSSKKNKYTTGRATSRTHVISRIKRPKHAYGQ